MTQLTRIASLNDIYPGKTLRVMVGDKAVLLANVDGDIFAVDDLCSHEDFSLYRGCLKGDEVECSLHGARFNVRTGQPTHEPATCPIATYQVTIEGDDILLDTGTL
ncbi:unnamed protein product [Cyprideis torosa]|uniref:Uncharacterized protein n=1 Tax=Cyprideis torosa TaxID=163714 RepID=A0A7R8X247_9CRUS|nr:unnamed protein product [Cyprideis torosa]CAG0911627.1 unnamed protein product [Cyprideis torosa]